MSEGSTKEAIVKPPSTWPSVAVIRFKNVCMAYGESAPLILKNVSFTVNAGEKIGSISE